MFSLTQIPANSKPLTNKKSLNKLKHYIANMILFAGYDDDLILPPTRELARITGYSKTVVGRNMLRLIDDNWIVKKKWGNHPRQCVYVASVDPIEAKRFKNFYLLPASKKRKILNMAARVTKRGQKLIAAQEVKQNVIRW